LYRRCVTATENNGLGPKQANTTCMQGEESERERQEVELLLYPPNHTPLGCAKLA